jgi:hypothetical protein
MCQQITGFDCFEQGGTFRAGANCASGTACDTPDGCPLDALYSQPPSAPATFTAGTSEVSVGVARFDDFTGIDGAITGITWWGLDLAFTGSSFVECVESNNTFLISFHANDAGTPGLAVCNYSLLASRTPTGRVLGGFDENRYRVDLPAPCPLTNGWVSIVGAGDPACQFLWVSTPEVDDRSYCDICDPQNQPFDLSFCLRGSTGGATGACCDWSTGNCADGVDIADCADVGQRFAADNMCQNLDPACAVESGSCCRPNGSCGSVTAAQCATDGGRWLGPNASCALCPKLGGCCVVPGNCTLDTAVDCASAGRTFAGEGTTCDDCPPIPTCGPESIYSQQPDGADFFVAYLSEVGSLARFEDLPGLAGTVETLTWWGLDLEPLGGGAFLECADAGTFDIAFYEDAAGVPGELVCTYTVTPTYVPTIHRYLGATLNEYSAVLPTPCVVRNPWVSLVGRGDPSCQFYWMSSSEENGTHFCTGCQVEFSDFNLTVCAGGTQGGVFGACCTGPTATCSENTEISACTGTLERFILEGECVDFDPACGIIIGACCFSQTATCAQLTEADCTAQQGSWLGGNSLCSRCPCAVACPPQGIAEGEPTCFDGYNDTFNSGCSTPSAVFKPLDLGDAVCGEGGVHLLGEEFVRDLDWYEVDVDLTAKLTWSVEATFPIQAWIIDGRSGCPGVTLTTAAGEECDEVSISTVVSPGRYWLVVGAIAQTDTSTCGSARYVGEVSVSPPNGGDVDGDGDIDLADYAVLVDCLFGPEMPVLPSPPTTTQQCLQTFDFNVDGDVDLRDVAEFMSLFGSATTLRVSPVAEPHTSSQALPANVRVERAEEAFRPGLRILRTTDGKDSADACVVGPE